MNEFFQDKEKDERDLLTRCIERCSMTHSSDDIIEHLEEELIELLLAIKRVKRGREPFINFIEELIDVSTEIETVLFEINMPEEVAAMREQKIAKFASALEMDNFDLANGKYLIDRYTSIMNWK